MRPHVIAFLGLLASSIALPIFKADCGVGVAPGSDARLTRWPYINSVSTNEAFIMFGTPTDVRSASVEYSMDASYISVSDATNIVISGDFGSMSLWTAHLNSLRASSAVCYRVVINNSTEIAGALSFTTAPLSTSTDPVHFLQFADFGKGNGPQIEIRDRMNDYLPVSDFIVTGGDNAYEFGSHTDFQERVFDVYREQWTSIPIFPSNGNHDYYSNNALPYLQNFRLPQNALRASDKGRYYSFNWGPIHFMSLDTEDPLSQSEDYSDGMTAWLEQDLTENSLDWKVAFFHKCPWTGCPVIFHGPERKAEELLVPIFEKHHVQLVLCGHHHFYERYLPRMGDTEVPVNQGGTVYITSGGGGDDLYRTGEDALQGVVVSDFEFLYVSIDHCNATIKAINRQGVFLDDYTFSRC